MIYIIMIHGDHDIYDNDMYGDDIYMIMIYVDNYIKNNDMNSEYT